jgi:membrane associated rhomboid family serine protease
MSNSQKYKPTLVLIALNIAFYVYTSVAGGDFLNTSPSMLLYYGQVNGLVLYFGWYWQLFTSMFVHANIAHIAGNMVFLFVFGLRGEEMFSLPEYLGIYFLGKLTRNLLSLAILPLDVPSVGASGAIFAMFGACTVYARRSVSQSIIGALMYAFLMLLLSSGQGVNNLAHLGGLGAGLVFGYLVATRRKKGIKYQVSYSYAGHP